MKVKGILIINSCKRLKCHDLLHGGGKKRVRMEMSDAQVDSLISSLSSFLSDSCVCE